MIFDFYRQFGALNSGPVFDAFEQGLRKLGHTIQNHSGTGDAAVIWSVLWNGRMRPNQSVYEQYRRQSKPVIVLEIGCLQRDTTWKIGINGINQGSYFVSGNKDDHRARSLRLDLKPWRTDGNAILICGQHEKSQQWENMPAMSAWVTDQITQIRQYTERPIKIRHHPRSIFRLDQKFKNVVLDSFTPFRDDLKTAWAVINWSSNPSVESVINGVPAFVGPRSLALPVANTALDQIETPNMPDRTQWLNNLAWTEWLVEEMAEGLPQQLLIEEIRK
jgi:hypothetical protein